MNSFGGTITTFPRYSKDFDKEWLSAALGAPVESLEMRYAGEGQTALTFVLHDIKYGAGAREGLPSSVAIKIHAESPEQRAGSVGILLCTSSCCRSAALPSAAAPACSLLLK